MSAGYTVTQQPQELEYDPREPPFVQRRAWLNDDPYYCKVRARVLGESVSQTASQSEGVIESERES